MQPYSLNDLVEKIESVLNIKMLVKYEPARKFDVPHILLDTSLAQSHLNWKPAISLDDGIQRTADWLQNWIIQ
jgi:UDP-glucose 4-epimerase